MTQSNRASVHSQVQNIIKADTALKKGLARKIINIRALAKYVAKKFSLNSIDSIISAIRRFDTEEAEEEEEKVLNVFSGSIVRTKNDVSCITFNAPYSYVFEKISEIENLSPVRAVVGSKELKILLEKQFVEKIKTLFDKKQLKKIEEGLSEISIMLQEKAIETKGVMAKIATEIALENINIIELVVCPPEFLIYVKQKDIVKAHETVLRLCG